MKGDFSRDTFHPHHRYARVLMQQGRVLVDADWNEQTSILLHYIRTLAVDLIGPHGGPGRGFEILCSEPADPNAPPDEDGNEARDEEAERERRCDFVIGQGRYYVDGILVENLPESRCPPGDPPPAVTYRTQPDLPLTPAERLKAGTEYLVYLDVWERHVTHLEAGHIREVALGGPDTSTRSRVVWQVKVADRKDCGPPDRELSCAELLRRWVRRGGSACMKARARVPQPSDDPCLIPPDARYRGAENQLYRVEIHDGGKADVPGKGATFKWSRDNGSVVFGLRGLHGKVARLDTLGPDTRRTLDEGDWVEVLDDRHVLRGRPGVLARVEAVDPVRMEVTLAPAEGLDLPSFDPSRHPLLRRWDHASNALPVREGKWIDLEDGVQVQFELGSRYRTGDHWLVPARTETGNVLWPTEADPDGAPVPRALGPHGIEHHYAPLARIRVDEERAVHCVEDCRCIISAPCAGEEVEEAREEVRDEIQHEIREEAIVTGAEREAVVNELREITHVGRVRANVLLDRGFRSPEAVRDLSTEEVRTLLGVSDAVAEEIRVSANRVVAGGGQDA